MTEIELLNQFAELIDKVGIGGGALLIVVFVLWRFGPALNHLLMRAKEDREFPSSVHNEVSNSVLVDDALRGILYSDVGADRAWVAQYHNGEKLATRTGFKKLSITHERVRAGIPAMKGGLVGVPVGLVAWLNRPLLEERELRIPDTTHLEQTASELMHDRGTKSLYVIGLYGLDGTILGMVGIEFVKRNEVLADERWESFEASAMKICGMLISDTTCCVGARCAAC